MTKFPSQTPAEAEADAERARAGLVTTLDRLRENLQPANVVEEVMSSANLSASAISDQIWDTARRNPLPALMIGTGLAMILGLGGRAVSKTRNTVSKTTHNTASAIRSPNVRSQTVPTSQQRLEPQRSSVNSGYALVKSQASDLFDAANDQLSGAASKVASVGRHVSSALKPTGTPMSFSQSSDTLMSGISKVIEEQPLVLAAIGIAVGAAIGAAIPQTDAENSLMGESSHSVRDKAQGLVGDQLAQLKTAASHAVDDIKQSVADHGVTADNLSGLAQDVVDKAKAATYEAGRSLDPTKA